MRAPFVFRFLLLLSCSRGCVAGLAFFLKRTSYPIDPIGNCRLLPVARVVELKTAFLSILGRPSEYANCFRFSQETITPEHARPTRALPPRKRERGNASCNTSSSSFTLTVSGVWLSIKRNKNTQYFDF